ncbi:MAG TPA: hypothetical protein VEK86_08720 [Gemmatimonadales bacterium]|nr:hypothetical protein [Gemmatimonadales bacterium]
MRRLIFGTAVLALAIACSDSNGTGTVPSSQLHFVVQDAAAPPLLNPRDTFYAKVGDNREVRLYYQGAAPGDTGEEYLRFEVPNDGLYRKPGGAPFAPGDSILITVTVVDPAEFVFKFEPAGLQFNPANPARLKIEYKHSDHDFDGDGQITAADTTIEDTRLDLWRSEPPDTMWLKIGAVKFEELDELDANIFSFTQYAVAW